MTTITPDDTDILLVVDVQNDFCPGGTLAVPDGDAIVPVINELMDKFAHIALTQDWHPPGHQSFASNHAGRQPLEMIEVAYGAQILWPDHCVQGTPGAAFHEKLASDRAEMIVRKGFRPEIDSYSAFYENDRKTVTGLAGYLRERGFKRVFAAGLATDVCVKFTLLDAVREGFEAFLVEDGSRGIDHEGSLAAGMEEMTAAGVSVIQSSEISG